MPLAFEYDASKAASNLKNYDRMLEGTNVVLIGPDLMETFPNSEAVNEALRTLKNIADRTAKRA
jgi:hypothetical protein